MNWWITDPEVDSRPALCSRIQRTAWFDRGYKFMRHTTEAALGQGSRARCVLRQALVFQTVQKPVEVPQVQTFWMQWWFDGLRLHARTAVC